MQDECVRVQSFIDAKYKEYQEALPASDARPEAIIHAEWAMSCSYFPLAAWSAQDAGVGDAETFVPSVPPKMLPMEQRVRAQALLARLRAADRPAFDGSHHCNLHDFLTVLPAATNNAGVADRNDLRSELHVRLPHPSHFSTPV